MSVSLLACGTTTPAPPSVDPVIGTWTLTSAAGRALPANIDGNTVVDRGSLEVRANQTYAHALTYELARGPAGTFVTADSGTWVRQGETVHFLLGGTPAYDGTINGTSLVLSTTVPQVFAKP